MPRKSAASSAAAERNPLRIDPRTRRLLIHLVLAYLAAWAVGVGFGFALEQTPSWRSGSAWERALLVWAHAHRLPWLLDRAMLAMPFLGTNLTILPVMLVLGLWLWKRKGEPVLAVHLLVVCLGSLSLNPTMKYLLDRPRPDLFPLRGIYNWASYPSGHAILTTALYYTVALVLLRRRGWRWPLFVAPLVVVATCYSRIYLSVHWPTDLVGGLLIGLTWLLGTWVAFRRDAATAQSESPLQSSGRDGLSSSSSYAVK